MRVQWARSMAHWQKAIPPFISKTMIVDMATCDCLNRMLTGQNLKANATWRWTVAEEDAVAESRGTAENHAVAETGGSAEEVLQSTWHSANDFQEQQLDDQVVLLLLLMEGVEKLKNYNLTP
jgi:hypothetical protein